MLVDRGARHTPLLPASQPQMVVIRKGMVAACTTGNGSFGNGEIAYGGSLAIRCILVFCSSGGGLLWPWVTCVSQALQRPSTNRILMAYNFEKTQICIEDHKMVMFFAMEL